MKENLKQLKEVGKMILPKGRTERIIFLLFLVFYLSFSMVILYNTYIMDHPYHNIGLYLFYDTLDVFHRYISHDIHPLLNLLTYPFWGVGLVADSIDYKLRGVVYIVGMSTLVSLANVYIYRYIRHIIKLDLKVACTLTILFGFFATNLVNCFTVESYPFSLFFLSFSTYVFAYYATSSKEIKTGTLFTFIALIGGTTVSNVVKPILSYLILSNNKWKGRLIKGNYSAPI